MGTRLSNHVGPGRDDWRRHGGAGAAAGTAIPGGVTASACGWSTAAKPASGPGHALVDDERGGGFLAESTDHRQDTRGAGQDVRPAPRLSHGAGRRRAAGRQSGRHPLRWQRPHVRRRVHHLHARRGRQQPAHAGESHHALREHQERWRLRQAHDLRRQARAAADDRSARRQQHPDERDRVRRCRQVHRYEQRRCRRQARALLLRRRHRA